MPPPPPSGRSPTRANCQDKLFPERRFAGDTLAMQIVVPDSAPTEAARAKRHALATSATRERFPSAAAKEAANDELDYCSSFAFALAAAAQVRPPGARLSRRRRIITAPAGAARSTRFARAAVAAGNQQSVGGAIDSIVAVVVGGAASAERAQLRNCCANIDTRTSRRCAPTGKIIMPSGLKQSAAATPLKYLEPLPPPCLASRRGVARLLDIYSHFRRRCLRRDASGGASGTARLRRRRRRWIFNGRPSD